MWLDEAGAGNDFSEIFVRCPNCNIRRPLSDAIQLALGDKGIPALGYCNGERPWLGSYGKRDVNLLVTMVEVIQIDY